MCKKEETPPPRFQNDSAKTNRVSLPFPNTCGKKRKAEASQFSRTTKTVFWIVHGRQTNNGSNVKPSSLRKHNITRLPDKQKPGAAANTGLNIMFS